MCGAPASLSPVNLSGVALSMPWEGSWTFAFPPMNHPNVPIYPPSASDPPSFLPPSTLRPPARPSVFSMEAHSCPTSPIPLFLSFVMSRRVPVGPTAFSSPAAVALSSVLPVHYAAYSVHLINLGLWHLVISSASEGLQR